MSRPSHRARKLKTRESAPPPAIAPDERITELMQRLTRCQEAVARAAVALGEVRGALSVIERGLIQDKGDKS